jgi:hypothetical protein
VTARSSAEAKKLDPTGIVVFRQGDVGEYLREVPVQLLFATIEIFLLMLCRRILFSRLEFLNYTGLTLTFYPSA